MKKQFDVVESTIQQKEQPRGVELLFESTIVKPQPKKVGRPKHAPDWVRASFIVDPVQLEQVRAVAHWKGRTQREVVAEALRRFLLTYEEQHGSIQPIPEDAARPLLD